MGNGNSKCDKTSTDAANGTGDTRRRQSTHLDRPTRLQQKSHQDRKSAGPSCQTQTLANQNTAGDHDQPFVRSSDRTTLPLKKDRRNLSLFRGSFRKNKNKGIGPVPENILNEITDGNILRGDEKTNDFVFQGASEIHRKTIDNSPSNASSVLMKQGIALGPGIVVDSSHPTKVGHSQLKDKKSINNSTKSSSTKPLTEEERKKINQQLLNELITRKLTEKQRSTPADLGHKEDKGVQLEEVYLRPKDSVLPEQELTSSENHRFSTTSPSLSLPNTLSRNKGPEEQTPSLPRLKPEQRMNSNRVETSPFKYFDQIRQGGAHSSPGSSSSRINHSSNTSVGVPDSSPMDSHHHDRHWDNGHPSRRQSQASLTGRDEAAAPIPIKSKIQRKASHTGSSGQHTPVAGSPGRHVFSPGSPGHTSDSPFGYSPPDENKEAQYFVATEDWTGNGDLDVKLHEKLQLISPSSDGCWYMRSCVTGSKGNLPSRILAQCFTVSNAEQSWFFGNISRREAERRLVAAGRHGTFLIRKSESKSNDFSLSILDGDIVKHYRIRSRDTGGYFIAVASSFATLAELVAHYSKDASGLCARLAIPCGKTIVQPMTYDQWELDRNSLTLNHVLGRGHFGVVREGLFMNTTKVAIKELRKGRSDMQEFQMEVNALKNLRHERLLELVGVCTDMEPFLIVTEFLKNGSLLQYLKGPYGSYLRLEELLHIALQVAEGMTYLETHNYIHRDLAARNVLLDDRLNSKIADFGMSKLVTEEHYSASDNVRVPIKWTALEALQRGYFSSKSDVWSFGILLSEIMTRGMTPYRDLDNSQVLDFLVAGNRMRQEDPIETKCYNIMLVCWAKTPENRPTFYELQQKLTDYIGEVKKRYETLPYEK